MMVSIHYMNFFLISLNINSHMAKIVEVSRQVLVRQIVKVGYYL